VAEPPFRVTASLLIGKLQAFPQQNALTQAIAELGRLVKTIFILCHYGSEAYRLVLSHSLKAVLG